MGAAGTPRPPPGSRRLSAADSAAPGRSAGAAGAIPLRDVVGWVWRGKTVTRALMNGWLRQRPPLRGRVLDLGGGGAPSYLQVLRLDEASFFTMDMLLDVAPSFAGTLEQDLPVATGSIDTVLLFNTLEHLYDFRRTAAEMRRVLRPDGTGLVYVPFLHSYHTHRGAGFFIDDYFRYTESALRRLFADAGFRRVETLPLGGYGLLLAGLLNLAVPSKTLRAAGTWVLGALQHLAARRRAWLVERYPIGYAVVLHP